MTDTAPARLSGASSSTSTTLPFTSKTGAYSVLLTDCIINCTANTFTVSLPTASGIAGQYFIIKNTGSGIITIDGYGSETIDGALNKLLAVQNESITVASDGANWIII